MFDILSVGIVTLVYQGQRIQYIFKHLVISTQYNPFPTGVHLCLKPTQDGGCLFPTSRFVLLPFRSQVMYALNQINQYVGIGYYFDIVQAQLPVWSGRFTNRCWNLDLWAGSRHLLITWEGFKQKGKIRRPHYLVKHAKSDEIIIFAQIYVKFQCFGVEEMMSLLFCTLHYQDYSLETFL